jgi:hypothetical protein
MTGQLTIAGNWLLEGRPDALFPAGNMMATGQQG